MSLRDIFYNDWCSSDSVFVLDGIWCHSARPENVPAYQLSFTLRQPTAWNCQEIHMVLIQLHSLRHHLLSVDLVC